MSAKELREANLIFWIVKRRLIPDGWSDETINNMVHDYFKRMWLDGNAWECSDGFEEAWKEKSNLQFKQIQNGHGL